MPRLQPELHPGLAEAFLLPPIERIPFAHDGSACREGDLSWPGADIGNRKRKLQGCSLVFPNGCFPRDYIAGGKVNAHFVAAWCEGDRRDLARIDGDTQDGRVT